MTGAHELALPDETEIPSSTSHGRIRSLRVTS